MKEQETDDHSAASTDGAWRVETQPASGEVHVTQSIGPWKVEMHWPQGATQGGPASLHITGNDDGGLSSTVLRQIDFRGASRLFRAARQQTSELPVKIRDFFSDNGPMLRALLSRGITDEYLAVLSATYVNAVRDGNPNITDHLSKLVQKRPPTIKTHLKEARRRGLLTVVAGRAGGECTAACLRILADIDIPDTPDEEVQ